jgi:SpoVK/Ycf46/Vps4 family AAA+-type ATPase
MSEEGKFKILQRIPLEDLDDGTVKELPESDLCIQTDTHLVQFQYADEERSKDKFTIKPGIWTFVNTNAGLRTKELELKTHDLLETASNTQIIKKESKLFFDKLHVYEKYNKDPKRSILLYSQPGMGKSSTIAKISQDFVEEEPGTVVIFWDTADIRSSTVSKFLSTGSQFSKDCTRMLFIMEDIGGGNTEGYQGPKGADASLLELLDGASVSFRLPTFIIATTNTPENLLKSLADRPGRFDQMFELEGPNAEERVKLGAYIAKRKLTEEERDSLVNKKADGLSIAHITEIVVRSELHDKTFGEVIDEMIEHKARIERAFEKAQKKKLGLMG